MLGVIIVVVVITALAVGIGIGVSKGSFNGLGNALSSSSRSGSRMLNVSLVVIYLGVGICVPLLFIIGNRDKSNAQVGGVKLTAAMQSGREIFAEHCASCHTLAADNAVGKTGPNLDTLKPNEALILKTIANGCVQGAAPDAANNCIVGYGTMPPDVVQGRDAQNVAKFVAAVAGHI